MRATSVAMLYYARTSGTSAVGIVPLVRHKSTVPFQQSVGRGQSFQIRERPATDRMCLPRKPTALCVGESQTLVAQAGSEKSVLCLQVADHL